MTRGRVRPGERVLVTGASGGVGSAALQLLRAMGCEAIAVTSAPSKTDHLKALGADTVIVSDEKGEFHRDPALRGMATVSGCCVYNTGSRTSLIPCHRVTVLFAWGLEGSGVDMVLECVGEPTFRSSLNALRRGGRMVLVGNVTVGRVPLPIGKLIIGGLNLIGSDSCTPGELLEVRLGGGPRETELGCSRRETAGLATH